MDIAEKLERLGASAQYDIASSTIAARARADTHSRAHYAANAIPPALCRIGPTGRRRDRPRTLLRVLMTDACEHDCHFCPLRASAPRPRTAFEPTELARLFGDMHNTGRADGLFLSSATAGTPDATMERMLAAAERIRTREGFDGYIHLKLLPGVSDAVVEATARLASRVSINIEAPNGAYLAKLGTGKDMARDILRPMRLLHRLEEDGHLPSGISTQYVVGAAGESDREIVASVRWLSTEMGLRRAYFGLFQPAPETAIPDVGAIHPNRQTRLYQADWLARIYGFADEDVDSAFDRRGNLPLGVDPKVATALAHPERFPLDVNRADYDDLLRVPGIGPIAAERIVSLRQAHGFSTPEQLRKAGVAVTRAAPFVLIGGQRPENADRLAAGLRRKHAATPDQFGVQLELPGLTT